MMPMITEGALLVTSELSDSGVNNNITQLFTNTNTSESNEIVTAPISLPLITGKIDNVITPENPCEYSQWKRTLCVDGLIRYMPVNENNIVIKNPQLTRKRRQKKTDTAPTSAPTSRSVLPIVCKNIKAELHKERFGSGSRGHCIRYNGIWYTPNEFEVMCGKATIRNWKRSIKFDGRSIQAWIKNGILVPHTLTCACAICSYDESSTSPILLSTPYSYQNCIPEPNEKKAKIENVTSQVNSNMNTIHQTNNDSYSKEAWQKIAESPDANAATSPIHLSTPYSYQNCIPEPNEKKAKIFLFYNNETNVTSQVNSNMNTIHQTNNDSYSKEARQKIAETPDANAATSPILLSTPYSYQNCIPEPNEKKAKIENVTSQVNSNMNTIHQTNNDSYSKEAWQKIAESPDANAGFPPGLDGVLKRLDKINETLERLMGETKHCVEEVTTIGCKQMEQTASSALIAYSTEPVKASQLNVDGSETKACANCNRKALSECSLCRRTPYCSSFCQNKDWGSHRVECLRTEQQQQQSQQIYLQIL